jgi:hypothetical protein
MERLKAADAASALQGCLVRGSVSVECVRKARELRAQSSLLAMIMSFEGTKVYSSLHFVAQTSNAVVGHCRRVHSQPRLGTNQDSD